MTWSTTHDFTSGTTAASAQVNTNFTDVETLGNRHAPDAIQTTLPGSPVDGQIIYFQADASAGVYWQLRYRSGSGSSYKWEFIGGPPLFSEVATSESTSSTTFADLATVGPSITLPLAGDFDVEIGTQFTTASLSVGAMSYAIGATAASGNDQVSFDQKDVTSGGATGDAGNRPRRKTGLTAVTLTAKYVIQTGGTAYTFNGRWMRVTPVRVG